MTDIVIPFQHSPNSDEELRYTLRSIEKFVPDVGEVFIYGDKPKWDFSDHLHPVMYTHKKRGLQWKEYNIAIKLLDFCNSCYRAGVEKDLYIFHDDNFLLRPWSGEAYHCGQDWLGRGYYAETEANTRQLFPAADNWDLHGPHKVNSQLFRRSVGSVDWTKPYGYCIKTVYHYMNGIQGIRIPDVKLRADTEYLNDILKINSCRDFFSISDEAWKYNATVRSYIQELYPNKSRWEK